MGFPRFVRVLFFAPSIVALACLQGGCVRGVPAELITSAEAYDYDYVVGPGDALDVFVWGVPELSQAATVRPDGKISLPLVEDLPASGKTPTQLAREIEKAVGQYVREPLVTVLVGNFQGVYDTQIRVIGEVGGASGAGGGGVGGGGAFTPEPKTIPYTKDMTLLDVMIEVGGLTAFAAGNRTKLVRTVDGQRQVVRVRLEDLVRHGDMSANIKMAPGDVVIVPESWF